MSYQRWHPEVPLPAGDSFHAHPEFVGLSGPYDRYGHLRGRAYQQAHNRLCPSCQPGYPRTSCDQCGGYGEVPA